MQTVPDYEETQKQYTIPDYILSLAEGITYWSEGASKKNIAEEIAITCYENEEALKEQLAALGWGATFCPDKRKWYACPFGYSVESGPGVQYYPKYRRPGADQGPRIWSYYYQPRERLDEPQKQIGFHWWHEAYDYLFAAYQVDQQELPVFHYELYSNNSVLPVLTTVRATSPEQAKQIYLCHCIEQGFIVPWQVVDYRVIVSKVAKEHQG